MAGATLAATVGAGATAALLPFALQHNLFGAMDTLVASAAVSVAGSGTPPSQLLMTELLSKSNTFAFGVIIPIALINLATQRSATAEALPSKPLLAMIAEKDAAAGARARAAAAAAIETAENAFYEGSWVRGLGSGLLCEYAGDDGCSVLDAVPVRTAGNGAITCLQVEKEGRLVWVCV